MSENHPLPPHAPGTLPISDQTRLHMVTVLPPPVTGQTLATQAMAAALSAARPTRVWAVTKDGPRFWSLKKHRQMIAHLRQAAAASQGRDRLYLVPDAGHGLMVLRAMTPLIARSFRDVFFHHHAFGPLQHRSAHLAASLDILRGKARHIVLGQGMAQALTDLYGVAPDHIDLLGNSALIPDAATPTKGVHSPETLGYLGNITRAKGILEFMRMVRLLRARGAPAKAVIAGPLASPDLRADLEEFLADDPENRRYLGPVDVAGKARFFAQIDALVFPSTYRNEAQPLVVLEALAAGRPVLATPCGVLGDDLPQDWLFRVPRFAEYAARHVQDWQADPKAFAQAETLAQTRWQHLQNRDAQALARIVQRLA